jgi:hypothetical protein
VLEDDGDLLLEELRRVRPRQPLIQGVLDRQANPRPRLGLLPPVEDDGDLHLLQ